METTSQEASSGAVLPFQFDGEGVRVVLRDGAPWFVGKDVAKVLGYSNVQKAVRSHCKKQVILGVPNMGTPPIDPQTLIIPEGDVYRLVMRSKLPSAERFENWVVDEVLPSIRKTGSYGVDDAKKMLDDPAVLQRLLLEKVQALEAKTQENLVLKPKAEAFDRIGTGYGSRCITDAAKVLQVQPRWLFNYLRVNGWIYRRAGGNHDVAYQQYIQNGCLEHKVTTVTRADGSEKVTEQVRVTDKGLAKLSNLLSTATKLVPAGEAA